MGGCNNVNTFSRQVHWHNQTHNKNNFIVIYDKVTVKIIFNVPYFENGYVVNNCQITDNIIIQA